ncbi:MAG: 50S ribosomal protein L15 [Deltaproteobacteria bacterium]|nr:50S ribosomal protein L15 [Deltaproteobacteria bacterium]
MASILSNLRAPLGAVKTALRKGRGVGSGLGKTAGKGQKGPKARHPGTFGKLHFQGGQTPMQRRLPKRGFNNPFPTEVAIINLAALAKHFQAGAVVDPAALVQAGLLAARALRVKILGNGDLDRQLTLKVHAVSAGARAKIEAAGGTVELLPTTVPPSEGNVKA